MDVAVRAAAGEGPQTERAHRDQHDATRPLGARRQRRRHQQTGADCQDRTHAKDCRVAKRKSHSRAQHSGVPAISRSIDGQRGDRHQVIATKAMQESQSQG